MKKLLLLTLFVFLCCCVKKVKVDTILEDLPTIDIQTYFEDVNLQQVNFEKCEGFELCLSKKNACKLYDNIKKLKEHITYIKASYVCDISAYKEILNKKK